MQRGHSACGDKTLLDVLVPVSDALDENPSETPLQTFERIASVAAACSENTKTIASLTMVKLDDELTQLLDAAAEIAVRIF